MAQINLNLKGTHCKSCKMVIEDVLGDLGAMDVHVEINEKEQTGTVSCEFDDKKKVTEAIQKEGYKVV